MVNTKNHLYTEFDELKNAKDVNKKRTSSVFSQFSSAGKFSSIAASFSPPPQPVQIQAFPQIGDPVNNTFGSIGSITQTVPLDVYGSNYSIFTITDDVNFAFTGIPLGRHLPFSLDITIDKPTGTPPVITLDPRITNTPTLPTLADGTKLILYFTGANYGTASTFTYVGGTIAGSSSGGGLNTNLSNLADPTIPPVDLKMNDHSIVGLLNLDFDSVVSTIHGLANLRFYQANTYISSLNTGLNVVMPQSANFLIHIGSTTELTLSATTLDIDVNAHLNDNSVTEVNTIGFSATTTLSPISANVIGASANGSMLYNIGGNASFHNFEVNGDSIATIYRIASTQGRLAVYYIDANSIEVGNHIQFDGITGNPPALANGDMWFDSTSGLFKARQGGDTVNVIGGSGGGLNTNLSNLSANAVPTVALDMNDQAIQGVSSLDFDGVSSSIHGLANLNFYQGGTAINSLATGLNVVMPQSANFLIHIGATTEFTLSAGTLELDVNVHLNNNSITEVDTVGFSASSVLNPVAANIIGVSSASGSSTGVMIYNVGGLLSLHNFEVNGNSIAKLRRMTDNTGQLQIESVHANNLQLTSYLQFTGITGDPPSLANGDMWFDSTSGLFKAQQGDATVNIIGLNTNLSNLSANAVPTVALDMNDNDINGVSNLDFDGVTASIHGLTNLNFYQTSHTIQSLSTGLSYHVPSTQTHLFLVEGVAAMTLSGSFLTLAVGFNANSKNITSANYLSFVDLTGNTPGDRTIWYDGTLNKFRANQNNVVVDLIGGGSGGGATVELDNLGTTAVNANINMGSNSLTFTTANAAKISADSARMLFGVPASDAFIFQIGGVNKLQISSDSSVGLDVYDIPISNVSKISFNRAGQEILNTSAGIQYRLPSGEHHGFFVNGIFIFGIQTTRVILQNGTSFDAGRNYFQYEEISKPGNPSSNSGRMYTRDVSGVTTPFWLDSAGTESSMISGGLNTNLSNLSANAVPTVALDMNDNDINGVSNLDFDGVTASIHGLTNLNFYQTSHTIQSLSTGLSYHVPSTQTHLFLVEGVAAMTLSGSFLTLGVHLNANSKNITSANYLSFVDLTGNTPGDRTIWYDGTLNKFRANQNNVVVDLIGGSAGISFPINFPEHDGGNVSGNVSVNFSQNTRHARKYTLTGNVILSFTNPPANSYAISNIVLVQNGTGSYSVTLPSNVINRDTVQNGILQGANEETGIVIMYRFGTYYAFLETGNTVNGGGSAGATVELNNLGTTAVNADINMGDSSLTFTTANAAKISADSSRMLFGVPSTDAFTFQVNDITVFQIQSTGGIDLYNERISNVSELSFNVTGQDIESTSAGIEYHVPTNDAHIWRVNDVTIASLQASGLRLGTQIPLVVNSNYVQFKEIGKPTQPASTFARMYAKNVNGVTTPFWYDSAGNDTSMIGGGTGGGLNTNLSNLSANAVPTVALDMNDHDINGVSNLDFDGVTASIHGLANLIFYGTQSINSLSSGLSYHVPTGDTHDFIVAGVSAMTLSGSFLTLAVGFNANSKNITSANYLSFVDLTGNTPGDRTIWYDGTLNKFRANQNNVVLDLIGGGSSFNPSAITDSLVPSSNDSINLGSSNKIWNNLYVDVINTGILQGEGGTQDIRVLDDLDLQNNVYIDFSSGASAPTGNPIGAVQIKVGGTIRLIPYYST